MAMTNLCVEGPASRRRPAATALVSLVLLPLVSLASAVSGPVLAAPAPTDPPAEQPVRQRLQQRQQDEQERWRRFGDVEVDWTAWQPLPGREGIWFVPWRRVISRPRVIGGQSWPDAPQPAQGQPPVPDRALAVDCRNLQVNRKRSGMPWGEWRVPIADSAAADLLVAACTVL